MKRKTKDGPIFAFIRKGNSLIPEFAYDAAALDGIAQGQRVKVSIDEWRNRDRLRAYWAMLTECNKATEAAANVRALHAAIKLETGLVELIALPGGHVVKVPSSIALEAMPEAEMIAYFESAERYLAQTFGWVSERNAA
jgi:crotonobetainyl-CoA:carnitine CoA-transferase CaiB-like acyl-CoA transferase